MSAKLPPLPSEIDKDLDAVKEKVELNFKKCSHKQIEIVNNELRCPCGAGYSGPNIAILYKAFKEH